jgi:hypothetical protein
LLPHVSGDECVRVLLALGFDATGRRGDTMWLERDARGIPVPLEPSLEEPVLAAILRAADIAPREFDVLLGDERHRGTLVRAARDMLGEGAPLSRI